VARDESPTPGTVAVVGLGLMGGSLVRRLRSLDHPVRLLGVDADSVVGAAALEQGWVDRFALPGEGMAADADLVVLACPLRAALAFFQEESSRLPEHVVVTDVVGLNQPVLERAGRAGLAHRTGTAHPMCGSEESGFGAARADLYHGAPVWLSALDEASPATRRRMEAFWGEGVGADPRWTDAQEHDRTMAWVSHLPQIVSNALAGALDAAGFQPADLGPGGRDMTRLAASDPEVWTDLLEFSAPVTGTGLTSVSRALNVVADLLARRDMDRIAEFMELTRSWSGGRPAAGGSE